jgi:hypothetical protein
VCPPHITPSDFSPLAVESESECECGYKGMSTAHGSSLTHMLPVNMPSPPTCQMQMKGLEELERTELEKSLTTLRGRDDVRMHRWMDAYRMGLGTAAGPEI